MFPTEFDYRRPITLDEALEALADEEAVPLAGGHSLVPAMKARERAPETLVDLADLDELRGVEVVDDGVHVGALTTYAAFLDQTADVAAIEGFREATRAVGDRQIRNRGTVGGNLAAADPRGDLPAAALAVDATLTVRGSTGARSIPVTEFFVGDGGTALASDELLTGVRLPGPTSTAPGADAMLGGAYAKKTHPSEGYAAVGVAARVEVDASSVRAARVAVNGVFSAPRRLETVGSALVGLETVAVLNDQTDLREATEKASDDIELEAVRSDHLVSARQRRRLLPKYTRLAVTRAVARATGAPADEGVVA